MREKTDLVSVTDELLRDFDELAEFVGHGGACKVEAESGQVVLALNYVAGQGSHGRS